MNLVVFSHKPCWSCSRSPTGFATSGGFPFQMAGLAAIFDKTTLVIMKRLGTPPDGLTPLEGHGLEVRPLPEPPGLGWRRKLSLLYWGPRHLTEMWRQARRADAVHATVPGDIGTLGLFLALATRRPLFVLHCGTWGTRRTAADRFLLWLLSRMAGGQRVVMATGGGDTPPAGTGGRASWIFSTTLSSSELAELTPAMPWQPGEPLRLVTVGRLSRGKNAAAIVAALPEIRRHLPGTRLDVAGGGPCFDDLARRVKDLELADAVTLHGNLPHTEVMQLLQSGHLFVFPTRTPEGFPKAVLEALACGLPILAPPVSVLPQLLAEGGGWLLDDTDPAAVSRSVLAAASEPDELRRRAISARQSARLYSLEAWQELIRQRLEAAWGEPLRLAETKADS